MLGPGWGYEGRGGQRGSGVEEKAWEGGSRVMRKDTRSLRNADRVVSKEQVNLRKGRAGGLMGFYEGSA